MKSKWLLFLAMIASIGFNKSEARLPYAIAKTYIPYLLYVFDLEENEKISSDLEKQEKASEDEKIEVEKKG